ncbi:MAG: peptide-methionine (S)-S-oxide reductase MsrA [Candidatus Cloacimonetes bacterium]|nr:peptide-methionine (S)-S-oxide reductase MsrA [Candidatus Cloacimonadota bacterium]
MMTTEVATFGGGCFWCLEAAFLELDGVLEVQSGYAGGHVENPDYRTVCTGTTGHAEVVQVTYDPGRITYDDLLNVFFTIHDPTTPDRQGNDVGPQYRSIILYHDEAQAEAARRTIERLEQEQVWSDPIVTEVVPLRAFYPAEPEHNRYYERNPNQPYCTFVVAPKVAKVRKEFFDRLRRA